MGLGVPAPSAAGAAPGAAAARVVEEPVLSPVYSLAVHSQALWLLAGCDSGAINLQSVRHDEGRRIHSLMRHHNAVSVLQLAPDERSVLSGGWDKAIYDWDLDTGGVKREFAGNGGQISALELRPMGGVPIPAGAGDELAVSDTYASNNAGPFRNKGAAAEDTKLNIAPDGRILPPNGAGYDATDAHDFAAPPRSPGNESLFGGSDTSLFGDNQGPGGGGGGTFGDHDEDYGVTSFGRDGGDDLGLGGLDSAPSEGLALGGLGESSSSLDAGALTQVSEAPDVEMSDAAPPADGVGAALGSPQDTTMTGQRPASSGLAAPPPPPLKSSRPTTPTTAHVPMVLSSPVPPQQHDPSQVSHDVFLSSSMDGTMRIWDRRAPNPAARMRNQPQTPPWCMGACWSPDGNWIYAGRRNGTVEEYSLHKASAAWAPQRALRFPNGSGPVSAVRAMPNGRHLVW
jgi:transcriptional activator SPT8